MWALTDETRIADSARDILWESKNSVFASMSSFIEIGIKTSLGKLSMNGITLEMFPELLDTLHIELIAIEPEDCYKLSVLNQKVRHRDPFDRLIISQAINRKMILISPDKMFLEYEPDGLNLIWD
jgi:PIN domain nuclease of toxin-antitoxin system